MGDIGIPDYGHRLLPHIIDDKAREDPQGEALSVPRSDNPEDGWKAISWKEYANAINHAARKIVEECGKPAPGAIPTIAYIGPNDARYLVLVIAAVKAGYKTLFISPRNSQEGQINLFNKTDCNFILFPASHRSTVQPWLEERDMKAVEVGPLETWTSASDAQHIPFHKSFTEAEWDPFVVLHTSGSTGLPKPIVISHGMFALCDAAHNFPIWRGKRHWFRFWEESCEKHFVPMPLFHAAGLYLSLNAIIYWGTSIALGMAGRPLSTDLVIGCLSHSGADSAVLPATILEEISHDPVRTKVLTNLKLVAFGGSHLATEAGEKLVKNGVKLSNVIAATECFPPAIYEQPPELWSYFLVNREFGGVDWRPYEDSDAYRMVIKRRDKHPGIQGVFYAFPELQEWDTKDLFRPHPELPDNWTYYGRSDDVIVFSNGEKLNPVSIEAIVQGHPELKGALVVGAERFHPALILEPFKHPRGDEGAQELIDRVWPRVVQANKETVAHGQISRQFVVLSNPNKPFLRAGKGTIQRAGTVKLYKEEIDEIYEHSHILDTQVPQIKVDSEEALSISIVDMFRTKLGAKGLNPDSDFFAGGVDSLQVINATRLLKSGLEAAGYDVDATAIATRAIYGNPTPRRLAQYLLSVVHSGDKTTPEGDEEHELQAMKSLWQKYTSDLQTPQRDVPRPEAADEGQTVIVTGTTGMLGSYMLDQLVRNPLVKRVICLNRDEDGGAKRQAQGMRDRGLAVDWAGKAEFYRADMSRAEFGLPKNVYQRLLREVDRVIHNAWPVNFNMPIESFEPYLRGVRGVADFATFASKRVAVAFISSIGTADNWDTAARGPVPEKRLEDLTLAGGGYGRSKMIGSLILEDVAKAGDFPAAIIRVGQIAGPEADAGVWNRHEWLPSIIASSARRLGALPGHLGAMNRVDWTPCERVAGLVLEVLGASAGPQKVSPAEIPGYYHAINPLVTTWDHLAPAVQRFYGEDRITKLVSFGEWVDLLAKSQTDDGGDGAQDLDRNPAVKLLDFYRGTAAAHEAGQKPVVFDVTRTKERSRLLRTADAITPKLMMHWCKQWGF